MELISLTITTASFLNSPISHSLPMTYFSYLSVSRWSWKWVNSIHAIAWILSCVKISSTKQISVSLLHATLLRFSGYKQNEVSDFFCQTLIWTPYSQFPHGILVLFWSFMNLASTVYISFFHSGFINSQQNGPLSLSYSIFRVILAHSCKCFHILPANEFQKCKKKHMVMFFSHH